MPMKPFTHAGKFAVEQERTIKESELNTEIAVEEKKKQIAEKKMEAEVQKAENNRKVTGNENCG